MVPMKKCKPRICACIASQPFLQSATVHEFPVSYELMAEAQCDISPEQAAARVRDWW
jgi:galactose-1-phosphate uridylyltransferase